ncbi:hypothetical protein CP557_19225 [Natrinema ejinorense]|uniref:Uncharacterized protein n=1 Tax=Natrinema ejinorense TaxID=373386 RepID=A0A2A5R060_9EURY|nr:hypothetical protein CP557_19225 [Natrinema ejinorense]
MFFIKFKYSLRTCTIFVLEMEVLMEFHHVHFVILIECRITFSSSVNDDFVFVIQEISTSDTKRPVFLD